jgi:hypothetical protein
VAEELGRTLAERGITVVYGGAKNGLMGVLARSAVLTGGRVVGVLPRFLKAKELAFEGLDELHDVDNMHERKAKMAELSEGFIALPGGLGTLEEFFEVATWGQIGLHPKPCGLLNAHGYFDKLLDFLDHTVAEGFVKPVHRAGLLCADNAQDLLAAMAEYRPTKTTKWWGLEKT